MTDDPTKPADPPLEDPDDGEVPDVREDTITEDNPAVDHEPTEKE